MFLAYSIDTRWKKGQFECYFDIGPYRDAHLAAQIAEKVNLLSTYCDRAVVELTDGEILNVDHRNVHIIRVFDNGDIDYGVNLPGGLESLIDNNLSFTMISKPIVTPVSVLFARDILDA